MARDCCGQVARRRLAESGPRSPKGADAKVGFKECLERLEKAEASCCCGILLLLWRSLVECLERLE